MIIACTKSPPSDPAPAIPLSVIVPVNSEVQFALNIVHSPDPMLAFLIRLSSIVSFSFGNAPSAVQRAGH